MTLPRVYPDRSGVALPLALFTLVIAAVMITAVFYVGRLEQRMGTNAGAAVRAFEAAETGVGTIVANWDAQQYNALSAGSSMTLPSVSLGANAVYSGSVHRINTWHFLVQVEGRFLRAGTAITRRQLGQIVRLDSPVFLPEAAVINRLGLTVTGSSTIDGDDHNPGGWSGCTGGSDEPAIVDSTGMVTTTGPCAGQSCLSGSSRVVTDIGIDSLEFLDFRTVSYSGLASAATKIVSGSVSIGPSYSIGPTCQVSDNYNWGSPEDPSGACGGYFPIIHATGDLDITGGTGQGLLLVDGNLTLSGSARFYGVIVVQKSVSLTGGEINGSVFIRNADGTGSTINGTRIRYSRCAVLKAAAGASLANPLSERSWVQLY